MAACFGSFKKVGRSGLPRKQNDVAPRHDLSDANRRVDARHALHDYVADQKIGREFAGCFNGCFSRVHSSSFETAAVESRGERVCNELLRRG